MPESKPHTDDEQDVFIVITGDPVQGFIFTGPFTTHEAAEEWARDLQDWWSALLQPPEQRDT
jgi:hypothetical protein